MRDGAVINMSGGIIDGRITQCHTGNTTLNFSGSAKIPGNGSKGNNVSTSVTVNIGKLDAGAYIGFQCSGAGGADSADTLNGNKFLANINDPASYDISKSSISVYMSSDNYNRTYELFVENGKLYAKQTSRTAK